MNLMFINVQQPVQNGNLRQENLVNGNEVKEGNDFQRLLLQQKENDVEESFSKAEQHEEVEVNEKQDDTFMFPFKVPFLDETEEINNLFIDKETPLLPEQNDEFDVLPKNIENERETTDEKKLQNIKDEVLLQQVQAVVTELFSLMKTEKEVLTDKEFAGRLLKVLKDWSLVKDQLGEKSVNDEIASKLTEKELKVWQQLMNTYEKRSHLTHVNMYQQEATITKADVVSWLDKAFSKYANVENKTVTTQPSLTKGVPMTEVEQYTIHVNQLNRIERIDGELIDKFQKIIQQSHFLHTKDSGKQLSIMLHPESLGNMTVKLTQVDGEMTVKIIVSSQFAKEMLENNMHQLKHMFSPHQVMIEREESISDDELLFNEHREEEEKEESDELAYGSNEEDKQPDEDFEEWLNKFSEGA